MSSVKTARSNPLILPLCPLNDRTTTGKYDIGLNDDEKPLATEQHGSKDFHLFNDRQHSNSSPPLISERPIDQPRPLKLIYIGAGISGIVAAIQFLKAVPHLELTIYEKNPELGGTWFENRYPGCACDVPSHTYQLSFESWTEWSHFFSGSDEILEYWKRVAQKYDVRKHIHFNRRCNEARWNNTTNLWTVQIQNLLTGNTFEDSADVLMTGTGLLNEWKWPSIPGLQCYEGQLLHSASWDEAFTPEGKAVAVIGSGSTAVQIVPAIIDNVKSMDHYIRGGTWISNQHGSPHLAARTNTQAMNFRYTEKEKRKWRDDPSSYLKYRKELELEIQSQFAISQRDSDIQKTATAQLRAGMRERLKANPELLDLLLPDFPPLCNRLTPAPGYLEALVSPKVNVIGTAIARVDESGIITTDGKHRPVEAIICATGFEKNLGASFPIIGRDGSILCDKYADRPETYLGLCTDGFPNFFQSLGPNSFQGAGNLLIMIEQTHAYVAQILSRMAYGNVGIVEPKRKQVLNFTNYAERYFERTVYSSECNSWYKSPPAGATTLQQGKRGHVTALWPGSSLHAIKTLEHVRWEDFETTAYDGNEIGWFGNGWAQVENSSERGNPDAMAWYMNRTSFLDGGG
ncbi:flavin-binding monooxygenase [Aspergillus costaricaensis CBS 115574]|uniref:Flavin-binding monooxygenase n=1 Tax=Aspergillus costaricaensis CBS 115574 TaxID=1448317 RepID=A0ACD1ID63_9EURO|nr:flavin-binding monooxygenase [Aspergillus costaricaensis CBS 115574]RAK87723.1 flavin-binding monooxygenase [Aspergillus costaricaensis CBS 115574]